MENQRFARHLHPMSISTSRRGGTCHSPAPRPRAPRCLSPLGPACPGASSTPCHSTAHTLITNQLLTRLCIFVERSRLFCPLCAGRMPFCEGGTSTRAPAHLAWLHPNPGPPEALFDDAPRPHHTGLDCPFSGPSGFHVQGSQGPREGET